jgi:hypothetical protein
LNRNDPILVATIPPAKAHLSDLLERASARSGRSQVALLLDMTLAALGPGRIKPIEYFVQGVWLGRTRDIPTFVGAKSNRVTNRNLTATGPLDCWDMMTDKFVTGALLAKHGFPVPEVRAVYASARRFPEDILTLTTAAELARWIGDPANLPVFAKPNDGTMALGSVPIMAAARGAVDIGGRVVDPLDLAREVAAHYPNGWLLQEQLRQPDDIEAMIGPGIGTVRVVTLWEEPGPEVLYGVWRVPPVGTWVDAAIHGAPNVGCTLDAEGRVTSAMQGDLLSGAPISHSLINPGVALTGYQLAQWPEMTAICKAAHRLFPGHALIGWDIAMTGRGPVISEVNASPLHLSYQRAFKKGFLHAEHRKRLDAARRLMRRRAAEHRPIGALQ